MLHCVVLTHVATTQVDARSMQPSSCSWMTGLGKRAAACRSKSLEYSFQEHDDVEQKPHMGDYHQLEQELCFEAL